MFKTRKCLSVMCVCSPKEFNDFEKFYYWQFSCPYFLFFWHFFFLLFSSHSGVFWVCFEIVPHHFLSNTALEIAFMKNVSHEKLLWVNPNAHCQAHFPRCYKKFPKPLSQPIIVMTLIKWNEIHSCRKRRKALSQFLNIIHLRKPSHSNSGAGFLITTQKFPVVLIFFLSVKAFLWPRIRSIHFCINPLSIFNHTTSAVICYIT